MATFDCPQVYFPPQPDVHVSADFSPKPISHSPFAAPHPLPDQAERSSLSFSEPTSTTFGSDNERVFSSGDEDSLEFHSDSAYDSVASRATMSKTSGPSGLEIERLFEDPSAQGVRNPVTPFDTLPSRDSASDLPQHRHHALSDQSCRLPSPRENQTTDQDIADLATPNATRTNHRSLHEIPSSPPSKPIHAISPLQQSRFLPASPNGDFTPAVEAEQENRELWGQDIPSAPHSGNRFESPYLPRYHSERLDSPRFEASTHLSLALKERPEDPYDERRLSIFDWSEQPRAERDHPYGSSPRPRTMHSKQANDARSGRPSGRRAPNALHLRSQSVPVAKELPVDNTSTHMPAKFGTWGLGNKGVSEEWTDDFDFDEGEVQDALECLGNFTAAMKVPQAIIDRQASVHGQFGLVQEFMLLVEELKRLRYQGSMLDLLQGSHLHLWEDAESIINLATLNDDEDIDGEAFPTRRPSRFSGNFDDFDEVSSPIYPSRQHQFPGVDNDLGTAPVTIPSSTPVTPPAGRARGESLAQAKSFLQNIHQNRRGLESSPLQDPVHPPKLPFDTQDLRDLVARTSAVTRSLKEIVRKAEGVFVSPARGSTGPQDPPFSHIFHQTQSTSPDAQRMSLTSTSNVDRYIGEYVVGSKSQNDQLVHLGAGTGS